MLAFLLIEANTPFAIATAVVIFLAMLEGVGLVIGFSLSNLLDHISPIELDLDAELNVANTGLTPLLGWLCLNRLPMLVWIVLFLTCFAIIGYSINFISYQSAATLLPTIVAAPIALIIGLFATAFIGRPLARLLPKNESLAVSKDSFSGSVATITVGTAKFNSPAEAVLVDQFNQKHYVMVAPERDSEQFATGSQVVLLAKSGQFWLAAAFSS